MKNLDRRYGRLRCAVGRPHGPAASQLLDDAYTIVATVHASQFRRSGDPYIQHPVEVAWLLATWRQPLSSICAALLHDVPDVLSDLQPVRDQVGDEVVDLVEQSYLLDSEHIPTDFRSGHPLHQAAIIKLADRLHNARTWRFVPRVAARTKARQTLNIYAPVAAALGLAQVARELTALATATLDDHRDFPTEAPPIIQLPPVDTSSHVAGLAGQLLGRAVMLLPPARRHRYFEEWSAELLNAKGPGARLAMALGLNFSALRMCQASASRARRASSAPST